MVVRGQTALRAAVCVALAVVVGVLVAPAGAAPAEQIVITLVDEEAEWEFEDPCVGGLVHGVGLESGTIRREVRRQEVT